MVFLLPESTHASSAHDKDVHHHVDRVLAEMYQSDDIAQNCACKKKAACGKTPLCSIQIALGNTLFARFDILHRFFFTQKTLHFNPFTRLSAFIIFKEVLNHIFSSIIKIR